MAAHGEGRPKARTIDAFTQKNLSTYRLCGIRRRGAWGVLDGNAMGLDHSLKAILPIKLKKC